jgi:hypothetical protein
VSGVPDRVTEKHDAAVASGKVLKKKKRHSDETEAPSTVKRPKMEVRSYDEQMAKLAARQKSAESKGGTNFISTAGGHFSINDKRVKGDVLRGVIVDSIFSNVYYDKEWKPGVKATPSCYAFSFEEEGLRPHKDAREKQSKTCEDCPLNAFGTARVGKGKACKNQRRIGIILEDDLEDPRAPVYLLNVAVTSTKSWREYVRAITSAYDKPTACVLTAISIDTPEDRTTAELSFTFERELEPDELDNVLPRQQEVDNMLTVPFPVFDDDKKKGSKAGRDSDDDHQRKFAKGGKLSSAKASAGPSGIVKNKVKKPSKFVR